MNYSRAFRHTACFLFLTYNKGESWTHVTDRLQSAQYLPGRGIYAVGYDFVVDSAKPDSRPQRFWIVRKGQLVNEDTIGDGHDLYPLPISDMIAHPLTPQVVFYQGYSKSVVGITNVYYFTIDEGRTWNHLDVPPPTEGFGFQIELRFDYADAAVWYFGVDGDDVFGGDRPTEWHKTSDSGKTFERVQKIGRLNGLFGEGTYVEIVQTRGRPNTETEVPVNLRVTTLATGRQDTLQWFQSIQKSLFPNIDTSVVYIYTIARLNSETQQNFGISPRCTWPIHLSGTCRFS